MIETIYKFVSQKNKVLNFKSVEIYFSYPEFCNNSL